MSSFQTKILFLILTLLTSLVLLIPSLNYIPMLSTGDHGRDFYCPVEILNGQIPYHDFWWVYGPLMPYFYAVFYKIFGIHMSSILIGRMVLVIICEIFFYLTLARFAPPLFALIGTLWFLLYNQDFFFTYNHIGGVACILGSLYFVISYLKDNKSKYIYLSFLCLFILSLIKINFALSSLCAFILSVRLIEYFKKYPKKSLGFTSIILLCTVAGIYGVILSKLPVYEIRQCFPYLSSDQPHQSTPWEAIRDALMRIFFDGISSKANIAFGLLIIFSGVAVFKQCFSREQDSKSFILPAILVIVIFYLFNIHEYILSGTTYRAFWVKPLSILLVFTLIYWATKHLRPIILFLLYTTLIFNIFLETTNRYVAIRDIKQPGGFLNIPRANVYLGNDRSWIDTVMQTTQFLRTHLKTDETFFALPYDCLYYFLAEKTSPTRQLIFFDHINIPQEQEIKIIHELEAKKVNWVVVSSRSISVEGGLGKLGVTYCPLIGKYIADHFEMVQQFGPWTSFPGWGSDHGTRIMRRVPPL